MPVDTVRLTMLALDGMLASLTFNTDTMAAQADSPYAAATDLADFLVDAGACRSERLTPWWGSWCGRRSPAEAHCLIWWQPIPIWGPRRQRSSFPAPRPAAATRQVVAGRPPLPSNSVVSGIGSTTIVAASGTEPTPVDRPDVPDFDGSALGLAPRLLGWRLEAGTPEGAAHVSGVIVETEAYGGADDPASHAFGGLTGRNRSMFGRGGTLYVYRIYGMHWCANVVCGPVGEGTAVLLRAVRPESGLALMARRRPKAVGVRDFGSGPGKLTAAFGIGAEHDGLDLLDPASPIRLIPPGPDEPAPSLLRGPRVGISRAADRPWRFAVAGDPNVSRPRAGLVAEIGQDPAT